MGERAKRNNRAVDIINQDKVRKGNAGGEGERRARKKVGRENGGGGIRDKKGEGKNGRTSPPVFTT